MNKKITTKKGTISLLAVGLIASPVSLAVVSCNTGAKLEKIARRVRDPKTLTLAYNNLVDSWNTAYSQKAANSQFLSDLYAGALAVDEYGRTYGDTLDSGYASYKPDSEKGSIFVGADSANADGIHWEYKVRSNAAWYRQSGEKVRNVKSSDFDNTAAFALNSNSNSQISGLWTTFVNNATQMRAALSDLALPANRDLNQNLAIKDDSVLKIYQDLKKEFKAQGLFTYKIKDTSKEAAEGSTIQKSIVIDPNGFGLETNDETGAVRFILKKSAPYFETALTYSAFSPIHEEIAAAGQAKDKPADIYSGAYLPKTINPSSDIVFVKNVNYHFASKTEIETVNWLNITTGLTPEKPRVMFESGELDGFAVNVNDPSGYKKYIGDDYNKPNFGSVYVSETIPSSSFTLNFNYYNTEINSGSDAEKLAATKASKILQNKDVRALMATTVNRSFYSRYYSSRFDDPQTNENPAPTSKNLSNIYTSDSTAIDISTGEDYTSTVAKKIAEKVKLINSSTTLTSDSYKQGEDALLNKSQDYINKSREELISSVGEYLDSNQLKTKVPANNPSQVTGEKAVLTFLIDPTGGATLNPFWNAMWQNFNMIKDNPIYVNIKTTTTTEEYDAKNDSGAYDLGISGWGPDYADPYTYLATFETRGDMAQYNGSARFIDNIEKVKVSGISEELKNDLETYTKEVQKTDLNTTDITKRYEEFAEQEYNLLYKNFIVMPFFVTASYRAFSVNHSRNFTSGRASYGNSAERTFLKRKNAVLWTNEQNLAWRENYRSITDEIGKDESRNAYKEGNVLFTK